VIRRVLVALSAALVFATAALAAPAAAEGFFESLFGGGFRRSAPPPLPPRASSFADPYDLPGREPRRSYGGDPGLSSGSSGGGTAFCVRTCDGRYFPLQRNAAVSPAELCKSFCPASQTAVFHGSRIDYAVGPGGMRYAELDNAFAYRDKVTDNCTCNGKDGLGLARVDIAEDASLRAGDIVATNEGLAAVRSGRAGSAEFTPIDRSSREWSKRLAGVKVTPAPPMQKITPVAEHAPLKPVRKSRRDSRNAQFR
jgi:hypothetical protein